MDRAILRAYQLANLKRAAVYVLKLERGFDTVEAAAFRPQGEGGPIIIHVVWPDDWQYRPQSVDNPRPLG